MMNSEEINTIAELVAKHVTNSINKEILDVRKDVDEHQRILKGKNGDPSLPELVRNNNKLIQENSKSIRKIYGAMGFVGGALVLEFISWAIPKLEILLVHATP